MSDVMKCDNGEIKWKFLPTPSPPSPSLSLGQPMKKNIKNQNQEVQRKQDSRQTDQQAKHRTGGHNRVTSRGQDRGEDRVRTGTKTNKKTICVALVAIETTTELRNPALWCETYFNHSAIEFWVVISQTVWINFV